MLISDVTPNNILALSQNAFKIQQRTSQLISQSRVMIMSAANNDYGMSSKTPQKKKFVTIWVQLQGVHKDSFDTTW